MLSLSTTPCPGVLCLWLHIARREIECFSWTRNVIHSDMLNKQNSTAETWMARGTCDSGTGCFISNCFVKSGSPITSKGGGQEETYLRSTFKQHRDYHVYKTLPGIGESRSSVVMVTLNHQGQRTGNAIFKDP